MKVRGVIVLLFGFSVIFFAPPQHANADCELIVKIKDWGNLKYDCPCKAAVYLLIKNPDEEKELNFESRTCIYRLVIESTDSAIDKSAVFRIGNPNYVLIGNRNNVILKDETIDKILEYVTIGRLREAARKDAENYEENENYFGALKHWFASVKHKPDFEGYHGLANYLRKAAKSDRENKELLYLIKEIVDHVLFLPYFRESVKEDSQSELYYEFGYALGAFTSPSSDLQYYKWSLLFVDKAIKANPSESKYWQKKYKLQIDNDYSDDMFETMRLFFTTDNIKMNQSDCLNFLNEWAAALSEKTNLILIASNQNPKDTWNGVDYMDEIASLY